MSAPTPLSSTSRLYQLFRDGYYFLRALLRLVTKVILLQNPLRVEHSYGRLDRAVRSLGPFRDELSQSEWRDHPTLRALILKRLDELDQLTARLQAVRAALYESNFLTHAQRLVEFNSLHEEETYRIDEVRHLLKVRDFLAYAPARSVLDRIERNTQELETLMTLLPGALGEFTRSFVLSGRVQALRDENRFLFRRFGYIIRNRNRG